LFCGGIEEEETAEYIGGLFGVVTEAGDEEEEDDEEEGGVVDEWPPEAGESLLSL